MMLRAKRGLMSRMSPWSTIARISLYMSYGLRVDSGSEVEQRLVARDRSDRSHATIGRLLVAVDGKNERYFFIDARCTPRRLELAVADAAHLGVDLRAAELLLADVLPGHRLDERRARRAPASRCSSPSARSRRGPGCTPCPPRPGPTIAATCGTTPLMRTCSRNRCPRAGEERDHVAGGSRRGSMRAPAESMNHTIGQRPRSAIWRRRVTFSSPVYPMLPPLTVKS